MTKNTDVIEYKKSLAKLLIEKSYLEGDFILSSGLKSDYYFDCRQAALHPEGAWLIGKLMCSMLREIHTPTVDGVGGMTMGADPLITATSLAAREEGLIWPGLIVRKEAKDHGTARALEGMGNFSEGNTIALLEDVVSTGGSVIKACNAVRAANLFVSDICCVLDREQGGREALLAAGCNLHSIFTRSELVNFANM